MSLTTVAPANIGPGILWNSKTSKYEVNLGPGLEIQDNEVRVKLNPKTSNILTVSKEGVYAGLEAPKNYYYVDYNKGNDSNEGTKDSPLKTINKAIASITDGTSNVIIFIKDQQTHLVDNSSGTLSKNASFTIMPYGEKADDISSRWGSKVGYTPFACEEYKPYKPLIKIVPNWQTSFEVGTNKYSPTWLSNETGTTVRFQGVRIGVEYPSGRVPTSNLDWRAILNPAGTLYLIECKIENADSAQNWLLVDDHDKINPNIYLRDVEVASTDIKNPLMRVFAKMTVTFSSRSNYGTLNGSANDKTLHWATMTESKVLKTLVTNATEKNYITNI